MPTPPPQPLGPAQRARTADTVRESLLEIEDYSGLSWASSHEAFSAALRRFGARRVGLLSPFDKHGNEHAVRMFTEPGVEVVASVGFSCANALHIAHLPDWAKEKAILELLATSLNWPRHRQVYRRLSTGTGRGSTPKVPRHIQKHQR